MSSDIRHPSPPGPGPGPDDAARFLDKALEPHLFMVLDGNHPRLAAMRHRMGELGDVLIGRGRQRDVRISQEQGVRRLVLRFPDPWMSSTHARLECRGERWVMFDPSSKNGSYVNGVKQQSAILVDGDLLQLGHTFFLYRDALPVHPEDVAGVQSDAAASDELASRGPSTLLAPLAHLFRMIEEAAATGRPVVISGESGTGKTLVAQTTHRKSGRRGQLVEVQCAALVGPLLERQLLGYGANVHAPGEPSSPGLIETAHGGTLLLDDLATMPRTAQELLVRCLRERRMVPTGSTVPRDVDLRIIATINTATDGDMAELLAKNLLGSELLGPMNALHVHLPPLRQRREDFAIVIAELLERHAADDVVCFSADAAHALLSYPWPGNIRELERCLRAALSARDSAIIELHHLTLERPGRGGGHDPVGDTIDTIELSEQDIRQRAELITALRNQGGDLARAARELGRGKTDLERWLDRLEIDINRFRR